MAPRARPLSPHLQIYRFTLTMAMSIIHRVTGIANYAGTVLLVLWLGAAALGEAPFGVVNALFGSWFGQLVLFWLHLGLFHHMLGGIRHFVWDTGNMLDPVGREMIVRLQCRRLDRPDARRLGALRVVRDDRQGRPSPTPRPTTARASGTAHFIMQRMTGALNIAVPAASSSGSWCASPARTAPTWSR